MSCFPRDDQNSNGRYVTSITYRGRRLPTLEELEELYINVVIDSMQMNLSTDSSKRFLPELSSPESRKEHKMVNGITKETLNALERQQSCERTNGHGSEMMRYLQDINASEAFAAGGDKLMAASNKEIAVKVNLKAWEVRFEELSTRKDEELEKGRAQEEFRPKWNDA